VHKNLAKDATNNYSFHRVNFSDYEGVIKVGKRASPYCHNPALLVKRPNGEDVCEEEGQVSQPVFSENTRASSPDPWSSNDQEHGVDDANLISESLDKSVVEF
jgi:hypothetical protein